PGGHAAVEEQRVHREAVAVLDVSESQHRSVGEARQARSARGRAAEGPVSTYRRQDRRAVAGTLIVLGLAALGLAIFYLDVTQRALRSTCSVHVLLPDAQGIRPGTPVTVAGIDAGRVTRIALAPVNSDSLAKAVLTLE